MDDAVREEDECQRAASTVVGAGCLLVVVVVVMGACCYLLGWWIGRISDREVAAYSVCERCGEVLDGKNVHASCAAEGEAEVADAR